MIHLTIFSKSPPVPSTIAHSKMQKTVIIVISYLDLTFLISARA